MSLRSPNIPKTLPCIWFALLMGAPYPPMGSEGFGIPFGPTSLSKTYAWAALGVLAGLWLASHPSMRKLWERARRLPRGIAAVGAVLSAAAVVCAWVNMALLLGISPGAVELYYPAAVVQPGYRGVLASVFVFVMGHVEAFAAAGSCACGFSWYWVASPNGVARTVRAASHDGATCAGAHGAVPTAALAGMVGLLQPLAWMLLLPHSAFPQPHIGLDVVDVSTLWEQTSGLVGLTAPLPTLLMGAFALITALGLPAPRNQRQTLPVPIAGLCTGILAFHLVTRVVPSLFETTLPMARTALAVYAACYVGCMVALYALRRTSARPAPSSGHKPPVNEEPACTQAALRSTLTAQGLAYLRDKKLTEREILTICAHVRGLTAREAGDVLNVGATTVREYRRRCRVKLGVAASDELATALPPGSLAHDMHGPSTLCASHNVGNMKRQRTLLIAALCTLVACGVLVLFPFQGAVRAWQDVWTAPFGMGAGLVTAWIGGGLSLRRTGGTAATVATGMGLTCATAAVLAPRYTAETGGASGPVGTVWALVSMAVFVACLVTIARWLFLLLRQAACPLGTLVVPCACALCAAVVCGNAGLAYGPCALVLAAASTVFAGAAACSQSTRDKNNVEQEDPTELSLLTVCACAGWMLAEIWRAQNYVSLVLPLQWGMLALLTIETYRCGLFNRDHRHALGIMVTCGLFVLLSNGLAWGVAAYGSLLVIARDAAPASDAPENRNRAEHSWHSPLIAGAAGLVGGTLVTNVYGYWLLYPHAGPTPNGGELELGMYVLIGAFVALVAWRRCANAMRQRNLHVNTTAESCITSFLRYKGLTPTQTTIALCLAEGLPVREVANQLGYAQSTIHTARSEIYTQLGVQTRIQLINLLKAQVNPVDGAPKQNSDPHR